MPSNAITTLSHADLTSIRKTQDAGTLILILLIGRIFTRTFQPWPSKENIWKAWYIPYLLSFGAILVVEFDHILGLLLYFGIPKVLTFGWKIGGILPATCEASMDVEGRDGVPCSLKRMREWTAMYLRGEDGYDAQELREMWRYVSIRAGIILLAVGVTLVFYRYMVRREKRREAMMAKGDEEKGRSKFGM